MTNDLGDEIPLAPPEPPVAEADTLVRRLLPELSADDARTLARMAVSDFHAAIQDRSAWEDRLAQDDRQYFGVLPEKTYPWIGCSNLHVPITMTGIEAFKPRLIEAVWGEDPPVLTKATEAHDEARQARVELFLNWQIQTQMDLAPKVTESAHRYLLPGTVYAKTRWRLDERRVQAVRSFPPETPLETILDAVLGADVPTTTESIEGGAFPSWTITVRTPQHREREATLTLHILPDEIQALIDRIETIYEGPDVEFPDAEDMFEPANAGPDPQKFPWIMQRLWLDEGQLRIKVRQGRFYEDAVETLLRGESPGGDATQPDAADVRTVRATVEGIEEFGESSQRGQEYPVLERYVRYDLDEDGLDEELVIWVSPERGELLLGWDYLDNLYATGRRPYRKACYFPIPGRSKGLSFPQIVQPIQDEINTIHNQRVDNGTIRNSCTFFYPKNWTLSAQQERVRPGEGIAVDDPARLAWPQWPGGDSFGQNEEALLMQMLERLTGQSDLSLGRQPNRVGATRTATGTSSLLAEAGLRFKTAMTAFQRFWSNIFSDILALDQQYLPDGVEFRVTGQVPEVIRLTSRAEIAGRYDVRVAATSDTLNRQQMRDDATAKLQMILNPMLLQLGLVGKKGVYRGVRRWLQAYGETDPDLVLEPFQDPIVRTPEQEHAMWSNGDTSAEPSMAENLAQHLDAHQALLANPAARAILTPETLAAAEAHVAKTIQLAQMQAVIQSMQQRGAGPQGAPAVGQQSQNAQIGRQQGMNGSPGPGQPAGSGTGVGMAQPGGMARG
jgi:hypothetical protein